MTLLPMLLLRQLRRRTDAHMSHLGPLVPVGRRCGRAVAAVAAVADSVIAQCHRGRADAAVAARASWLLWSKPPPSLPVTARSRAASLAHNAATCCACRARCTESACTNLQQGRSQQMPWRHGATMFLAQIASLRQGSAGKRPLNGPDKRGSPPLLAPPAIKIMLRQESLHADP